MSDEFKDVLWIIFVISRMVDQETNSANTLSTAVESLMSCVNVIQDPIIISFSFLFLSLFNLPFPYLMNSCLEIY